MALRQGERGAPRAAPRPLLHFDCLLGTAFGFSLPETPTLTSPASLPATRPAQLGRRAGGGRSARGGSGRRAQAGEVRRGGRRGVGGSVPARARACARPPRGRGGSQVRPTRPSALPAPGRRPSLSPQVPSPLHPNSTLLLIISHRRISPKPGKATLPFGSPRPHLTLPTYYK